MLHFLILMNNTIIIHRNFIRIADSYYFFNLETKVNSEEN